MGQQLLGDNHGQPGLRLPERRVARHVPECPSGERATSWARQGVVAEGIKGSPAAGGTRPSPAAGVGEWQWQPQSPRDGCEPGASLRACLGLASCCKGGKHDPLAVGCRSGERGSVLPPVESKVPSVEARMGRRRSAESLP